MTNLNPTLMAAAVLLSTFAARGQTHDSVLLRNDETVRGCIISRGKGQPLVMVERTAKGKRLHIIARADLKEIRTGSGCEGGTVPASVVARTAGQPEVVVATPAPADAPTTRPALTPAPATPTTPAPAAETYQSFEPASVPPPTVVPASLGGSAGFTTPKPTAPTPKESRSWYGRETIAVDLLAIGVIVAGVLSGGQSFAVPAIAGGSIFALGAPIIHATHGNGGQAVASLLLRVGPPLLAAAIAYEAGAAAEERCRREGRWFCSLGRAADTAAAGAVVALGAAIIDTAFLAWKDVEKKAAPATLVTVDPVRRTVGLAGSF